MKRAGVLLRIGAVGQTVAHDHIGLFSKNRLA